MTKFTRAVCLLAALMAAAAWGVLIGQNPAPALAWLEAHLSGRALDLLPFEVGGAAREASGPVVYYRDPDGKPFYSAVPKTAEDGRSWIAVRASEDVNFNETPATAAAAADAGGARKIRYYRNPMGLPDTSPVPKKDSMGMEYLPVYEGGGDDGPDLKISPAKIQKAGVRSEDVTSRIIARPVRAAATIQLDERRVSVVSLRFDSYLEKVADVTTGARVRKGDRLMRVFSPEVLAAAAQYRAALVATGDSADLRRAGSEGARRRLENMGLPPEFMAAIEKTRDIPAAIDWPAPRDGIIIERSAIEGMRAAAGETMFRLADASVVWALADVAERDLGAVKVGDTVRVTLRGMPGRVFQGKVNLIYPEINMATRTGRVRVDLANADSALMPNMFADAEIVTGSGAPVLAVHDSAVIDGGRRRIVIIDKGEGRFEPREVKTGLRGDGFVELREGVSAGDRVVVSANFLIDAESNLKAALQGLDQPEQPK